MSSMSLRYDAVTDTMNQIRDLRDSIGPSDALIDALKPALVGLATRTDLFPEETFRVNEGTNMTIYELSADLDGRLGLYASAGLPGKYQPPHDHRTWSCIAGVRGAEWNRYFERVDDGADPDNGVLEARGDTVLRSGDARGMMGHRFHAIEVIDEGPALHLHLYGDTLDRLAGRIFFVSETGGELRHFMTRPDLHTALVSPDELVGMLTDGDEIAVVDTRELGDWVRGHILRASPLPRSRLELDARGLLPRSDLRVVVIGSDNRRAHEAAHVLRRGGYRNIGILDGGIEACRAAGMPIHEGMGTYEKAFGEMVITELGTSKISVRDFRDLQDRGANHAFVDCRPQPEFEALRVPGARSAPGMTLLKAVEQLDLDDATPLIVSCAGRTRSIIGAQTLRDAGIPNPVMSLEDGAMGWKLAGGDLDSGPEPEPRLTVGVEARKRAAERARRLATERGIRLIDEAELASYRNDAGRCTYLFDVRTPDEYQAGHRAGFRSVAGGQLIQELTQRVAVHGARIVLVDEDGVEAFLTAHWLSQMGFEPCVLESALVGQHLATGNTADLLVEPTPSESVSWHAIGPEADGGAVVIDCSSSRAYRKGHIPGSVHCVRSELAAGLADFASERLIFTSEDGEVARFAAGDAARAGRSAAHLIGGNAAWRAAGQEWTDESPSYLVEPNDIWAKPYETSTEDPDSMRRYLEWEVELLETVDLSGLTSLAER